jgi:hypothetical protein
MHRHELFDDEFQDELEAMYRKCGAGLRPLPPAMLAMAVLIQGYLGLGSGSRSEHRFHAMESRASARHRAASKSRSI